MTGIPLAKVVILVGLEFDFPYNISFGEPCKKNKPKPVSEKVPPKEPEERTGYD